MAFIFLKYLTNTGEAKTSEVVTMHDGIVDLCLKESWPKIIWKFGFPRGKLQMRGKERGRERELYQLISSIGFRFYFPHHLLQNDFDGAITFCKCSSLYILVTNAWCYFERHINRFIKIPNWQHVCLLVWRY